MRRKEPAKREIKLTHDLLPPVSLLTEGPKQDGINDEVHKKYLEIGRLIEERCREFSVEGEVTAYHPGPVVTTFEFKPSAGVKYAKVVNLGDDLALALKAESIRIERISGSSTVGIEVPNKKRELIALRDIIETEAFHASSSLLSLALGKDIHGDPLVTDLAKMPHLLVAGATGAGKSVGLNSMIVSLLYKALPSQLRMLMIDPKMVELKIYEDIPHLLHPIITDPKLASTALIWAVNEMENRYRTLSECGVRNIDQYNTLVKDPDAYRRAKKLAADAPTPYDEPLQYIVIIIDEFADLMMVASKDVEDSVTRLAQKARAVGIHLIIATQRPSVDVITGVIKANLPSRISFQVASKIDSRTILDAQGAEKLLGNGDMLFLPPGTARVRRLHGAYVSESEINDIVDFVKKNQGEPKFLEEITKIEEEKSGVDGIEYLEDPKYDDAVRVVLTTGQASASYLQRRLKLGYSRAARLIEIMEANGIVGPSQGSKPREILVRSDDYPPASGQSI
jgi:S-DNA-T family DNA segregation ATPase FtsK/SpoIIIE